MFKIGDRVKLINPKLTYSCKHPLLNYNENYVVIKLSGDYINLASIDKKVIIEREDGSYWNNRPEDFVLAMPELTLNDCKTYIKQLESSLWPPR